MSVRFNEPAQSNTVMITKPIETSYDTICAAERSADRKKVRRIERYFANTTKGRYRSQWIVPTPFFVASEMASAVQAADLAIYCLNWGFRFLFKWLKQPFHFFSDFDLNTDNYEEF